MIKLKNLLTETLDDPYKYKCTFKTEEIDYDDEETGETYKKDVLQPTQIVEFTTENNIKYIWYAKQSKFDPTSWEIAFGVVKNVTDKGKYETDISITKTGNAFRIFTTIINITNSFIEFDDNYNEINRITLTSKEKNRTKLYIDRLLHKIEKFKIEDVRDNFDETLITMVRTSY